MADTFGLALCALAGAQFAEAAHCPPLIVVLMGTMTGVTGGILRDVITAQVPLILRREIYATAAIIGGIAVYLALYAYWLTALLHRPIHARVQTALRCAAAARYQAAARDPTEDAAEF